MYESDLNKLQRKDLVYPELSYQIIGVLFDVYNELGFGYSEKHYQKAIAMLLKERSMNFQEQVYMPVSFKEKVVGKYFLDFLIEDKTILEIKKEPRFSKGNVNQVLSYLNSTGKKLAILANFDRDGVKFRRFVNL